MSEEDSGKQEAQDAAPPPPPKAKSSGVGWLALLLVLLLAGALGGGAAWLYPQLQDREQRLADRVAELESSGGREQADLDALADRIGEELASGLAGVESTGSTIRSELLARQSELDERLAALDERLAGIAQEQERFNASDRDAFLLAEAEYLLRLANQRLLMAGDADAARALLTSADGVLKELDDPGLHEARAAVAADLAAVRAIPSIDIEGIYLRIAALSEQANALVIFRMPEQGEATPAAPAENWQERLQQGYRAALAKLSEYIIIRRRDVPMQALMDPQWEGLVRQNLTMLLEQAQVALLSGNQVLYTESLERAQY
ncbi:MAG: uroporphyrinogen III, partial [Halioglobus sp.]|nr:uroporphyrinogen III [Halioglobus sp.]